MKSVLILLISLLLSPGGALVCADSADSYPVTGSFMARLYARAEDDESNNDLYETLALSLGDDDYNVVTFDMYGYAAQDVDSMRDAEKDTSVFFVFEDITDSYVDKSYSYLHYAYLDINRVARGSDTLFDKLRIGRQLLPNNEFTRMDGLRVDSIEFDEFADLTVSLYMGLPANRYEEETADDTLYGGQVKFEPWAGNTFRIESLYIRDTTDLIGVEEDGRSFTVQTWQKFSDYAKLTGRAVLFDGNLNEVGLLYHQTFVGPSIFISAEYYDQRRTIGASPVAFDPLYYVMDVLHLYTYTGISMHKSVGSKLGIEAGMTSRKLRDENDESVYNHDFTRYYARLSTDGFISEYLELSVTWEAWETPDEDIRVTMGYSLDYKRPRDYSISVGYYYEMFKRDPFVDEEREEVATAYLKIAEHVSDSFEVTFRLTYEQNYDDDFASLIFGMRYKF